MTETCIPPGLQLQAVMVGLDASTRLGLRVQFEKNYIVDNSFDLDNLEGVAAIANTLIQYIGRRVVFWENQGNGVAYCFDCGGSGAFGHADFVDKAIDARNKG